jgi:hypothetical protein
MIFWIVLAVVGVAVLVAFVLGWRSWSDIYDGFMAAGVTLAIGFFVFVIGAFVLSGIAADTGTDEPRTDTSELRALSTGSSVEGAFFLGGGYIDGKRVLNYVVQHDGYSTLEQIDAALCRIYEDGDANPRFVVTTTDRYNRLLVPWAVKVRNQYDFHIPANSILESFTIDNAAE